MSDLNMNKEDNKEILKDLYTANTLEEKLVACVKVEELLTVGTLKPNDQKYYEDIREEVTKQVEAVKIEADALENKYFKRAKLIKTLANLLLIFTYLSFVTPAILSTIWLLKALF